MLLAKVDSEGWVFRLQRKIGSESVVLSAMGSSFQTPNLLHYLLRPHLQVMLWKVADHKLHLTRRLMSHNLEGICRIVSLFPDIARGDLAELGDMVQ